MKIINLSRKAGDWDVHWGSQAGAFGKNTRLILEIFAFSGLYCLSVSWHKGVTDYLPKVFSAWSWKLFNWDLTFVVKQVVMKMYEIGCQVLSVFSEFLHFLDFKFPPKKSIHDFLFFDCMVLNKSEGVDWDIHGRNQRNCDGEIRNWKSKQVIEYNFIHILKLSYFGCKEEN